MNILILIFNMFLAFFLAFQAGQIKAMIDIDKIDGKKPEKKAYILLVADILISIYLIISIYGAGVNRVVS